MSILEEFSEVWEALKNDYKVLASEKPELKYNDSSWNLDSPYTDWYEVGNHKFETKEEAQAFLNIMSFMKGLLYGKRQSNTDI